MELFSRNFLLACFKWALIAVLTLLGTIFIIRTWHWPLVGDAPLMHYVVFLMDHGRVPYRDIIDINLPGTYLVQGLVMHWFGGGSLAWRLFDLFLLLLMGLAMVVAAREHGWFAGFFAAMLFAFLHGRDGLIQLGQRDLMETALLMLGYVFFFEVLKTAKPLPYRTICASLFGFLFGAAATIKPSALMPGVCLIALAVLAYRRRNQPYRQLVLAAGLSLALPLALMIAYLLELHALKAFFAVLLHLIPNHAALRHQPALYLLANSISSVLLPLVLIWLPLSVALRTWRSWQSAALLIGILSGIASFCLQGKGYPYHRYPSESLLLLLIAMDFCAALSGKEQRRQAWVCALAAVGLAFGVLVIGAASVRKAIQYDWRNQEFDQMLEADLHDLGGSRLTGQVQCLDMAAGCLNALYRMQLVQATGFLYDCYLLTPGNDPVLLHDRRKFLNEIQEHPPEVFIATSHQCGLGAMGYEYSQMKLWPELADYLSRNYRIYAERVPPHTLNWVGGPSKPFGYRLYTRRATPLLDVDRSGRSATAPRP